MEPIRRRAPWLAGRNPAKTSDELGLAIARDTGDADDLGRPAPQN